VTARAAFGLVAPPDVLAETSYDPKAVNGGVLVNFEIALVPGLSVKDAGENVDPQPESDGSAEASGKDREPQAIESLFSTVTLKLTGEPAATEALSGESETVGAALVQGGVL
jgi:hypothetical protein